MASQSMPCRSLSQGILHTYTFPRERGGEREGEEREKREREERGRERDIYREREGERGERLYVCVCARIYVYAYNCI